MRMSENLDLENELQKLLEDAGDDFLSDSIESSVPPSAPPAPVVNRSTERVLSQAEIDALLASFNTD
jgi:hypothetical protein